MQDLAQRLQDRHDDDSFPASGYDEEIEQCDKYKDDQQRQDRALVLQQH